MTSVYLVRVYLFDEWHVDSIWTSEADAKARQTQCAACENSEVQCWPLDTLEGRP